MYPSYPTGLTKRLESVRTCFWQIVVDVLINGTKGSCGATPISAELGLTRSSVDDALSSLRTKNLIPVAVSSSQAIPEKWAEHIPEEFIKDKPLEPFFPPSISRSDVGFPEDKESALIKENADLKDEIEQLRAILAYATHSDIGTLQGGTMSYHTGDYHFHNKGHLLNCFESITTKTCDVIQRFAPRRFIGSIGGDVVQGRGIFKQQELENVLQRSEQQIAAAAWKFYEFDTRIKEALGDAPREWIVIQGNHDYSMGDSTCMQFVYACRFLGVPMKFVGTRWVQNIADEGFYNVFIQHGYGNNQSSPSPASLIKETLKTLLDLTHKGYVGEKEIKRVWHNHVHWRSGGIEQAPDVPFDVTGGLHRNDRVNIGHNQRPIGWWMFISPPGKSDILQPMPIIPKRSARDQDMDDPELEERNRQDASRCLIAISEHLRGVGMMGDLRTEVQNMR